MELLLFVCVILSSAICGPTTERHVHKHGFKEREEDGAFSPRDHTHYEGGEHHPEFDHEAILGSTKEAEEFDQLPPEEARKRLGNLLVKMDKNQDGTISRPELKQWILRSFRSLSEEEARERLGDTDVDHDGFVTWEEYVSEAYGIDDSHELDTFIKDPYSHEDQGLLNNDRELFKTADLDKDGKLNAVEYVAFSHPEEVPHMLEVILRQTLKDKDLDGDGFINFMEYLGNKDNSEEEDIETQKDLFEKDYDQNQDGVLDKEEFQNWMFPSNEEIAEDEVDHLFASSDDDHDDTLSFGEVLDHHDVFVGSEATDYGEHLKKPSHLVDEL
ncbi:reticulocalbin-2-like isoform X2 [Artemia franciscana]|uniref:Reticulocalbin-3 n=1 Tax=Artemia franciscana TaxID=6661 RepID=A0AA88I768_ARTSF|nr:hypothetical protein QYM36_002332 [Artemia franciscana]KAK2723953.1 hypothetical protein QYM36_002332 [Artemia franciscana]